MKKHGVLDNLEEMDGSERVMNGTWFEWWRGLIIGMVIQSLLYFLDFKLSNMWFDYNVRDTFHFKFIGYDFNLSSLLISTIFFIDSFCFLFFFAWKQPFKRTLLLGLISSIPCCLNLIALSSIAYKNSFHEKLIDYLQH